MMWRDGGRGGGVPRGCGEAGRRERADAGAEGPDSPRRRLALPGGHRGRGRVGHRHRHRQGANRPRDPRGGASPRGGLRAGQLRGARRRAVRVGAVRAREGRLHRRGAGPQGVAGVELSSGGTIFLDEVAELSPCAQAKATRVFQDREIRRLGGEPRPPARPAWVVAATNRAKVGMLCRRRVSASGSPLERASLRLARPLESTVMVLPFARHVPGRRRADAPRPGIRCQPKLAVLDCEPVKLGSVDRGRSSPFGIPAARRPVSSGAAEWEDRVSVTACFPRLQCARVSIIGEAEVVDSSP